MSKERTTKEIISTLASIQKVSEEEVRAQMNNSARLKEVEPNRKPSNLDIAESGPKQETVEPVQLALWSDTQRGVPNSISRSSLFYPGVLGRNLDRTHFKSVTIPSRKDVLITYTGEQLDTIDCDIFLNLLHLAKEHLSSEDLLKMSQEPTRMLLDCPEKLKKDEVTSKIKHQEVIEISFSASKFLLDLGKKPGPSLYKRLDDSLSRMSSSRLDLVFGAVKDGEGDLQIKDGTDLIVKHSVFKDSVGLRHIVLIDPNIFRLFQNGAFGRLDWAKHKQLCANKGRGLELAKWLHVYISGHSKTEPHPPILVSTLQRYTGNQEELYKFRNNLLRALDLLKAAKILDSYKFCKDKDNISWIPLP